MMGMTALRTVSDDFARLAVRHGGGVEPTDGWQDKSAAFGRAHMVGWAGVSRLSPIRPTGACAQKGRDSNAYSAISHLHTVWRRP